MNGKRLAILFPGQGSQQTAMGQALVQRYPEARTRLERFSEWTDTDMEALLCAGSLDADPERVHLAMMGFGLLAYAFLTEECGYSPVLLAGHSLGEVCALGCAGVLHERDALRLAAARGRYLAECCERTSGGMLACMGAPLPELRGAVEDWIGRHEAQRQVWMANINGPRQVVASGEQAALQSLAQALEAQGMVAVMLSTAGAFHTPHMDAAARRLHAFARTLTVRDPQVPVLSAMTGTLFRSGTALASHLALHVVRPVVWYAAMQGLQRAQVDAVIEAGPDRGTLCKLVASCGDWQVDRAVLGDVLDGADGEGRPPEERASGRVQ